MPKAAQTDLVYLDQLMTILKRHGASHFDDGSFRIDLLPILPPLAPFARPSADDIAEDDEEARLYRKQLADWAATQGRDPDEAIDDGPA